MKAKRLVARVRNTVINLSIAAVLIAMLGVSLMTGYIWGAVHTAKEYSFIVDAFEDSVKTGRTFYFNGIKVVPSKGRAIVSPTPREIASLHEARMETMSRVTGIPFAYVLLD